MERLTTEECRAIAERHMSALQVLDARDALARFGLADGQAMQQELGTDAGRPYRARIWAYQLGDEVHLCVTVDPMLDRGRPGLMGLVDAFRYGKHTRRSMQARVLPLCGPHESAAVGARTSPVQRGIPFGGMGLETHGRWPWVAAALVVPTWSLVGVRRRELREDGAWVAGLALPILVSHQSEEWVWPGGFLPFCNVRLLGSDRPDWPLTERDGFRVNVIVGWVSAVAGLVLWRRTPVVAAGVLYVEAGNVVMHVSMAVRERRYNPGVVTAALLLAPHAAAGARWLARSGRVSRRQGRLAAVAGVAFAALPLMMKLRMRGAPPPR